MNDPLGRTAVLVVSYETRDALRACLQSLLDNSGGVLEVVVADNASLDQSARMVRGEFPAVDLVDLGQNTGFGAAANAAAARTEREVLLILNPDCTIEPGSVRLMAERLDRDPELGYVGPRIELTSGAVDHASLRADPDPLGAALYFSRLSRLFPRSAAFNRYSLVHLDYELEQELLCGTAACLMVRAAAFRAVGGFDAAFFMYGEDLDLCRRLRTAGYRGLYLPSARAVHLKGEASRQRSGRMLVEFHRSMWTYYRKHEGRRQPVLVRGLVGAGIATVAVARLTANAVRRQKRVSWR